MTEPKPTPARKPFDVWMAELSASAEKPWKILGDKTPASVAGAGYYSDPASWRSFYDNGFEPSEAIAEDIGYWEEGGDE